MDFKALCDSLRNAPAVLAPFATNWSEADAHWKPEPGKWCLSEILGHLWSEETDDFRPRVQSTLADATKTWPALDPEATVVERGFASADPAQLFDAWDSERQRSLAWLSEQADADWKRAYQHPSLGPLTAGELLAAWVAHDSLHTRQIAQLAFLKTKRDATPYSTRYAG